MALAYGATTAATAGTGDLTWTHTGGTPRGALVWVVQNANATDRVSGVTYGGVAMTELAGSPNAKGTGEQCVVYGYFLGTTIPTGDQTVTVSVTGVGTKQAVAVTVTGAADTEVVDVDATINTDSAANPAVTLSLGGVSCFAAIGFFTGIADVGNVTPFTDWTSRHEEDFGAAIMGVYTYDTVGTTDVTAGWTQGADDAVMIAVAIKESAAAGIAIPVITRQFRERWG